MIFLSHLRLIKCDWEVWKSFFSSSCLRRYGLVATRHVIADVEKGKDKKILCTFEILSLFGNIYPKNLCLFFLEIIPLLSTPHSIRPIWVAIPSMFPSSMLLTQSFTLCISWSQRIGINAYPRSYGCGSSGRPATSITCWAMWLFCHCNGWSSSQAFEAPKCLCCSDCFGTVLRCNASNLWAGFDFHHVNSFCLRYAKNIELTEFRKWFRNGLSTANRPGKYSWFCNLRNWFGQGKHKLAVNHQQVPFNPLKTYLKVAKAITHEAVENIILVLNRQLIWNKSVRQYDSNCRIRIFLKSGRARSRFIGQVMVSTILTRNPVNKPPDRPLAFSSHTTKSNNTIFKGLYISFSPVECLAPHNL